MAGLIILVPGADFKALILEDSASSLAMFKLNWLPARDMVEKFYWTGSFKGAGHMYVRDNSEGVVIRHKFFPLTRS